MGRSQVGGEMLRSACGADRTRTPAFLTSMTHGMKPGAQSSGATPRRCAASSWTSARRKSAARHGGDQQRVELDGVEVGAPGDDDELLAVNEALDKLAAQHKLEAELVKLRFLVGMTLEEAGQVLVISARTADNYRAHARAWLFREIKAGRTSVLAFPFQRQLRVMAGARSFRS